MTWQTLTLGNRVRHDADRIGGCELVLPWPEGLPPGGAVALDEERDATPAEHAAVEQILGDACRAAGLVPVRSLAAALRRPANLPRPCAVEQHLIVILIGRRWVGARGDTAGRAALRWHPAATIARAAP